MKICKICGFDYDKPLGQAVYSAKAGKCVDILLNENGSKAVGCPKHHFKLKGLHDILSAERKIKELMEIDFTNGHLDKDSALDIFDKVNEIIQHLNRKP